MHALYKINFIFTITKRVAHDMSLNCHDIIVIFIYFPFFLGIINNFMLFNVYSIRYILMRLLNVMSKKFLFIFCIYFSLKMIYEFF